MHWVSMQLTSIEFCEFWKVNPNKAYAITRKYQITYRNKEYDLQILEELRKKNKLKYL